MKELVVCKSCGYVMGKAALKDTCPACGVPATMFEPYADRISPARRRILDLELHPIMVHFPVAFSTSIPILCLLALGLHDTLREKVAATIFVLSAFFPLVIAISFVVGMLDGKVRFRRWTTPILTRKLVCGVILFLLSFGILGLTMTQPPTESASLLKVLGLSIAALGFASYLGLLGARIMNSAFPG